ncbi:MAG: hypothetical protein NVV74_00610 [Magnetospirillum sp.]|nr:hypothetical protein [Magnetospirillum sp.]
MLRHQRDQVVRLGLRRSGAGLGECVACHAVAGDDGRAVAVSDDRHFCAGCHRSAAVSVDCFGCHRSTPDDRTAGGRP